MHDKIKTILPKEIRPSALSLLIGDCIHCGAEVNRTFIDDLTVRIKQEMLAEVHAKIPEIVALVEGEVREALAARDKIKEILK